MSNIKSVIWSTATDLHVLAGKVSDRLNARISIEDTDGAAFWADEIPFYTGISVAFIGEFEGAPSNHGVQVDDRTGAITVSNPRPDPHLDNFLVRAEFTDANGVFATKLTIRVHVHNGLAGQKAWFTPSPLSLHKDALGQGFTILAEFDDGTIGDITDLLDVQWSSLDPTQVDIDPDATHLIPKVVGDGAVIQATLPADWGSVVLQARAKVLPPWGTPQEVTFVAGPGRDVMDKVPNFLFLAEGFGADEKTAFGDLVGQVVRRLRANAQTAPFDLMKDSFNYWMTWTPSPEKGASVLYEVAGSMRNGKFVGVEYPLAQPPAPPAPPPPDPPDWTIEELLNEVGLPIPADAIAPGTSAPEVLLQFGAQMIKWSILYGSKVYGRISVKLYLQWAAFADRHLVDERNSALGLAVGGRPIHDSPTVNRFIGLHPRRTARAHLDDLFKELTDSRPPHAKIGTVWMSGQKDHEFVCALVAGTRYGGGNSEGGLIAASPVIDTDVPLKVVGGREVEMIPSPIPRTPSAETTTLVAHESSHAFGLGDEYGEFSRIPADQVAELTGVLNLQDEDSITTAIPPFLPKLDGSKLKWLWPRIAKAGVLAGTPTTAGGKFEVPVQPKHQLPFKPGDPVRIRARPLQPALVPSDLMFVSDGGVQPGKLVIEPSPGVPVVVSPVTFGVDSLIYSPVLQPVSGNPVLLVHHAVQDHITTTGQPLNAPKVLAPDRKCGDEGRSDSQSQPASNRPDGLKLPPGTFTAWIVGAYENGKQYFCGVYHPAGACIMRSRVFHRGLPDEKVFTMCPVCRYILVDKFAPTQHGRLDLWYQTRYPLDG